MQLHFERIIIIMALWWEFSKKSLYGVIWNPNLHIIPPKWVNRPSVRNYTLAFAGQNDFPVCLSSSQVLQLQHFQRLAEARLHAVLIKEHEWWRTGGSVMSAARGGGASRMTPPGVTLFSALQIKKERKPAMVGYLYTHARTQTRTHTRCFSKLCSCTSVCLWNECEDSRSEWGEPPRKSYCLQKDGHTQFVIKKKNTTKLIEFKRFCWLTKKLFSFFFAKMSQIQKSQF